MAAMISKTAQAMMYFLEETGEWIGHTRLMKLLYLADVEARKVRGHPITDFKYVWHHHGPWDTGFFGARNELLASGLAEPRQVAHADYTDKQLRMVERLVDRFTDEERHILAHVARTYMDTPLSILLSEIVYKTAPMKAVKAKGESLPMQIVNDVERSKMGGFTIAEMLDAERMAADGDFVPAEDFFDGLLAEASASDSGPHP